MMIHTQTVTGKIQEEQTESDDEISHKELYIPNCMILSIS